MPETSQHKIWLDPIDAARGCLRQLEIELRATHAKLGIASAELGRYERGLRLNEEIAKLDVMVQHRDCRICDYQAALERAKNECRQLRSDNEQLRSAANAAPIPTEASIVVDGIAVTAAGGIVTGARAERELGTRNLRLELTIIKDHAE